MKKIELLINVLKNKEAIDSIFDFFDKFLNFKEIFAIILVIVATIYSVISFRNKTNKITKNTISQLKKEKKYIPSVFVELNDTKETVRYFIYGRKWKKRIIDELNNLYDDYSGHLLENSVKDSDTCFHVKRYTTITHLLEFITIKINLHKTIKNRDYCFKDGRPESDFFFVNHSDTYLDKLTNLKKYTESSCARYLVLTGSAGNGKTNLLCSISELIISLKNPVVFVTGREIKGEPKEYIFNKFQFFSFVKNHLSTFLKIENFLLKINQKYFYIVIDAVNENEYEQFSEELMFFINEILEYKRFKVIVSCRNEYYNSRFRKYLVDKVDSGAFELDLKDQEYNKVALDRMFEVYKNAFNFRGKISDNVKNVLCGQLLLLRMFFETNSNSDKDISTICKQDVFMRYIEKISNDTSFDVEIMLRNIARIMIENNKYDEIPICALEKHNISIDNIKTTIDESVILSKKVTKNNDSLAKMTYEVVYFVFDELRDFILAREIVLSNSDLEGNFDSISIINKIEEISKTGSSALEGIIHYTYLLFRDSDNNEKLCTKLLEISNSINNTSDQNRYKSRNSTEFDNLGLRIIVTSRLAFNDFEKTYIRDCLIKNLNHDSSLFFSVMLKGTLNRDIYNLDTFLDILYGINNLEVKFKILLAIVHNTFYTNCNIPEDLIKIHNKALNIDNNSGIQVQCLAELFLMTYDGMDVEVRYTLELYFYNLENHDLIYKEVERRFYRNEG